MSALSAFRQKYPEYNHVEDKALADALHNKFYSDMPIEDYYSQIGLAEEKTSLFDDVVEFGQRTLGSAATQLAQVPGGFQERFFSEEGFGEDDQEIVERNRRVAQDISGFFGYDEGYEGGAVEFLSGAIGGALPSYGTALAGAGAGLLVGGPFGAIVGGGLGLLGGSAVGAGANVSAGMEETARAVEMGRSVSDEDYETAMRNQAFIGTTEGLPVVRELGRVFRAISKTAAKDPKAVKTITDYLVSAVKQGTFEAAQEAAAGMASNANLQEYINPDIGIADSLASDLGAGGVAGAFFDVAVNLATRKSRLSGLDDPPEAKPPRESLVAAEQELRDGIDDAETARRGRLSERLAAPPEAKPEVIGESLNTLLAREELGADDYKAFGQSVVAQMGDSFPTEPVFEIVENDNNTFQIQDPSGKTYGREVAPQEKIKLQPALVALNAQTIALGPESLSYSEEAANYAGGTVPEKGFLPSLSPQEAIKNNIPRKQQTIAQRINVRRLKNNLPTTNRFALSEIRREIGADVGRLADYESGTFNVNTFRALPFQVEGKFAVVPEVMNTDGQMEPAGDYIFDRPATAAERQAANDQGKKRPKRVKFTSVADASSYAAESNRAKDSAGIPIKEIMGDPDFGAAKIRRILDQKNISSDINSPEIKQLAARFTGNKLRRDQSVSDLTPAEGQLLYLKLSQLPRFDQPTKIPQFKLRPYTASQIATATEYYQANGKDMSRAELEYTTGKSLTDGSYREIARQARRGDPEVQATQEPVAALPPPSIAPETKKILSDAISRRLKALGLSDISGVVTDLVRNVERDADGNVYLNNVTKGADERVEGGYQRSGAKTIQVALDAIMSRANKPEDIESAVIDVLNHEIVHALRELDVITQQELQLLERLTNKYRKPDTNQTYQEWAMETYEGDSAVNISEEAVAEMIRDGISGRIIINNKPAKLTGKPRSIFSRIVKFFKGLFSTAKEADPDYESFTQFITDLESGAIGERQRGQIRTLYRLEQISGQFIDRQAPIVATDSGPTPEKLKVLKEKIPESDSLMEEAGIDDMMFSRRLDRADEQGFDTNTPYYHGTASPDIKQFRSRIPSAKGIIAGHFTLDQEFANRFVPAVSRDGEAGTVYPVFLRVNNTFDPFNKDMLRLVRSEVEKGAEGAGYQDILEQQTQQAMASPLMRDGINTAIALGVSDKSDVSPLADDKLSAAQKAINKKKLNFEELESLSPFIKAAGFDSYLDVEDSAGKGVVTGIAVFDTSNVKGVFAEYDPTAVPEGMQYEDDIMFSRRADLPPPENAQKTQRANTIGTYRKAGAILDKIAGGGRGLDFSSGLGIGAGELGFESYEPFPKDGVNPTYLSASQIPVGAFDKITNLNTLNVVPRKDRDAIVRSIAAALAPNGVAAITARGKEVMKAQGSPGPEPTSIITSGDTYQKGFTTSELVRYLQETLGSGFEVSSLNLGPAGALVKRLNPSDADILGENQVAFSRRAADRNVERSSQDALDKIISYVESTSLDPAGAATLEQGPIAFSVNAGFADQNGYAPSFTTPSRSWFDRVVFQVQDKLTDLKAIEEAINEARKARGEPPLAVQESAYIGEETIAGKLGEFDRRFQRNELQPLVDDMSASGVSLDEMDEFLVFRHAVERNERVRKINPSMPDAGSGEWNKQKLTDSYVKTQMLSKYGMQWNEKKGEWEGGNDRSKVMSRLASQVDKINSTTLSISQKGGLLTKQDREFLDGFFKYYTPLRGIAQDEDIAAETDRGTAGSGGSLSVVGKEVKRAMGRETEAVSPLSTIISDRGRQTARAVKNISFGKRLVELIKNNPNDDVWQLISPEDPRYKRAFDTSYTYLGPDSSRYGERKSDISKESDKKNWVKRVRVIEDPVINPHGQELLGVKVDGEQYYVHLADPSLRKAAINLDAESVGYLVERLNVFTRWMSYVNTSLNPEFVMGNFARDVQTAIYNIIGEQTMEGGKAVDAKKIVGQVLKRTIPSIKVFYKGYRDPSRLTGQDAIDFREFMQTGAKTDWFHSKPPEQQKKNIERMVDMANGTFSGNATQGLLAVKDFIDDGNAAVENGVRLATFVAARDAMLAKGIDRDTAIQQAATLAKNLTVNFNRRGNSGQLLNGLYLFFNASVQGTVNTLRGLNVLDPNSSRTKQAVVGGILGFGALMAALAESLMDEEELRNIPEYIRDRNMIIPDAFWGGDPKTYSMIPLPYGYNVFYNLGENAYLVSSGTLSKEDAAVRSTNVFLGSFNPLGTSSSETYIGSLLKTVMPQIGKPALELAMNENYFGAPIYPPDNPFGGFSEPLSRRSFKNTAPLWKNIAEGVSTFFDGNESESGAIEFPPDAMSYLIGYFGGGAGTFAERTFLKVPAALLDESAELEVRDIPFVRRVRGEINAQPDTERYYERRELLAAKLNQANKVLRGAARASYMRDNKAYFQMIPASKASEKALKSIRKTLREIQRLKGISPERAIELAQQEKRLQDRLDTIITRFNDRYDNAIGKDK